MSILNRWSLIRTKNGLCDKLRKYFTTEDEFTSCEWIELEGQLVIIINYKEKE